MHKKSTNSNANGDYDLNTGVIRIFWEEARMGLLSQHKIPSVFVHEIGHAYDRALGGGRMISDSDASIQKAYNAYKNTPWNNIVTNYAKTNSREFFADSFMERYIGSGFYKGSPEMNEFFTQRIEE